MARLVHAGLACNRQSEQGQSRHQQDGHRHIRRAMPLPVYHRDTDGRRPNHADDARQSSNRARHGKQQNHRTGCGQHRVSGRRGISGRRFSVDDERTRQQTLDTGDGQADHGEHDDLPGQPPAASNQRRNNADCGNCAADSDNQPGLCDGVHHAGGPGRYIVVQVFPDQFVVRLSVFGKHAPPPHAEANSDQEQTEYHAQYAAGDSRAHGKRVKPGQATVDIRCPIRIVHAQRPEIP